jgi:hypothetical protein
MPPGWEPAEVLARYRALGGTSISDFSGNVPEDHRDFRNRFRAAANAVSAGTRAGDPACTELAIRYIEDPSQVCYSGYARAQLARALKHSRDLLSQSQKTRLNQRFLWLMQNDRCDPQFVDYIRLWRTIITPEFKQAVRLLTAAHEPVNQWWWLHRFAAEP